MIYNNCSDKPVIKKLPFLQTVVCLKGKFYQGIMSPLQSDQVIIHLILLSIFPEDPDFLQGTDLLPLPQKHRH